MKKEDHIRFESRTGESPIGRRGEKLNFICVLIISGLGLIFGIGLSYASKVFAVQSMKE